jgi:hypothetical protein
LSNNKVLTLNLTDQEVQKFFFTPGSARPQRSAVQLNGTNETLSEFQRLTLGKGSPQRSVGLLDHQLRVLWNKVVKPVLDHLGFKASSSALSYFEY